MKIGIIQENFLVADFEGNAANFWQARFSGRTDFFMQHFQEKLIFG